MILEVFSNLWFYDVPSSLSTLKTSLNTTPTSSSWRWELMKARLSFPSFFPLILLWLSTNPTPIWGASEIRQGKSQADWPSVFLGGTSRAGASPQAPSPQEHTLLFREADRNVGEMLTTSFESDLIQRYWPKQNRNLFLNPSPPRLRWRILSGLQMPACSRSI